VDKLHDIWLRLSGEEKLGSKLHHRDIVGYALRRLESELNSSQHDEILQQINLEVRDH
jgi:hypothetical protein